jgi:hypothetical protein
MNRRQFLNGVAAIPVLAVGCSPLSKTSPKYVAADAPIRRVRPGDPGWPSAAGWDRLNRQVKGRLINVQSPLHACQQAPNRAECEELFRKLKNPFFIGDEPSLTQTLGWVDAWTSAPSSFAVAAKTTQECPRWSAPGSVRCQLVP